MQDTLSSRALGLAVERVVCNIPLLARALGQESARATIGYLVYKRVSKGILHTGFYAQSNLKKFACGGRNGLASLAQKCPSVAGLLRSHTDSPQ